MHQCVIYDSNQSNARLMGIESDRKEMKEMDKEKTDKLGTDHKRQRRELICFRHGFVLHICGCRYLISERLFGTLPEEEKKYWHSHQFEVSVSGVLSSAQPAQRAAALTAAQPAS